MLQGVINRMATNSFHLKGWSITLVAAMFALAASDSAIQFVYLAYFPVIAFCLLDAFYLHQEKLFRALYDHVRKLPDSDIDYSMDTSVVKASVSKWSDVVLSPTIIGFYAVIFASTVLVMLTLSPTK